MVSLNRKTFWYKGQPKNDEDVRKRMRELSERFNRNGLPMFHDILRGEGLVVNYKRTERIYREEGLSLRIRKRKRRAATTRLELPKANRPNHRWSMDFMSDRLSNGRRMRVLNIIDQYTRECLATEVDTSLTGARVVRVLDRIAQTRGLPEIITVDNGPEFSGRVLDEWATRRDIKIDFIRPGKPIENAYIESFNGKLRNECLETNWFLTMAEAREIIETWRVEYNTIRPHRSLGGIPPEKFASTCENSDGLTHLNQQLEGAISPK